MNYIKISHHDIANGDGVREVLWVAGCNHKCPNCHNPQTWDKEAGKEFDGAAFKELLDGLKSEHIAGLTISGGDPLLPENRDVVGKIVYMTHIIEPKKTIWMWTGYLWEEVKHLWFMQYVDVLVDGPYVEALKNISLPYCGSENQRVIDVQKSYGTDEPVLFWQKEPPVKTDEK